MEDGVTPNSRPVRFGFNPQEFPDFSWRGYAVMSPAQVRTGRSPVLPRTPSDVIIVTFLSLFPHCDCLAFTSALLFLPKPNHRQQAGVGMWTLLAITLSLFSRR